jgi:spore coat polysaccharide biosynthesis predicted glycosyltransferase SpsG
MIPSSDLRVLFRVAAGPRRGFGHLVRSISLGRAMGVRPLLSLRGPAEVQDTAIALGADVLTDGSPRSIRMLRPDVLVVDDPIASATRAWVAAARRTGTVVVTIHDLGLGYAGGDLVIDGSITRPARVRRPTRVGLTGARYAILDPTLPAGGRAPGADRERRVLVALGGGPRREIAREIAEAIAAADPRAEIRIAGGFAVEPAAPRRNITWIAPKRGLGRELARATVAVVGGGVSLYEACAVGVPTVSVPVVPGQTPTVKAFARRGAAVAMPLRASGDRTAAEVIALLDDPRRRAALRRQSLRLIDGRGAARAAAAVLSFAERKRQ